MSYKILNRIQYSVQFQLDDISFSLLQMKKKWFVFFLIFSLFITIQSRVAITSFPYSFTMPGPNVTDSGGLQYQFDMAAFGSIPSGADLHFTFQITNPAVKLSSTFMMKSTIQTKFKAGMIVPASFYGKSHADLQYFMDLNGMQVGRKQFIYHQRGAQTILYITVYNIDLDYRRVPVAFTINLTVTNVPSNPSLVCFSCNSGVRLPPSTSCLCKNCGPGTYGPDCSLNMIPISSGQTTAVTLNGPGLANFRIDQSDEVSINVRQRLGVGEVYFQFINFDGSFASHSNVAVGSNVQGRFLVQAGTNGATIAATSSGTPMSVTVAIYDTTSTIVEINYTVKQKSNILIIVLGVLGGVLFIGLVIAAIYIIRNSSWYHGSRQVRPVRANVQNMSDQQIQRFFPTVVFKNVEINKNQSTLQNLNDDSKKQTLEDCVICLCPIQKTQQVKVTYCKHIFHNHCLVGWFKKQQNCPYCRQQFTRSNTIKLYRKLKQMSNNTIMKGQQLVISILASKSNVVASKQSLQHFNQKQQMTRKIQIGSRNSFDVQNMNS